MPTFELEEHYKAQGFSCVCGVDEAGRGPLSGPVVAAACVLPPDFEIGELNDSKKLTPKKRDILYDRIIKEAVAYSIASASPEEIDEINILNATMLAMRRAIESLPLRADFALIDGNVSRGIPLPCETVIKGDSRSASIAAASILAKVTRDRLCLQDDIDYPQYKFAKHKGYGTKEHIEALKAYGPSPIHRRSFLKFLSDEEH